MNSFQTLFSSEKLGRRIIPDQSESNHSQLSGQQYLVDGVRPLDRNGVLRQQASLLTRREREVLQLIAEGMANKQAASELHISMKTVEKYRGRVSEKLGIRGTAAFTHYAIATGIVECRYI